MPWHYLSKLLDDRSHWSLSDAEISELILQAERDEQYVAAEHLRIILTRRNAVYMYKLSP